MRADYTKRTVLKVDTASLYTEPHVHGQWVEADFELYSGQLALVRIESLRQAAALADALCGLLPPVKGTVRFFGRDWQTAPADTANAMRGRIGRVFSSGTWLDGLDLAENIMLAQLHHTRRTRKALLHEAARLAEQFGLPGLPTGQPNEYIRTDLQRAALVRAFMGRPALLLLEDPTFRIYPDVLPMLINAIRRAGGKGAVTWWMTLSEAVWSNASIPADRRFRVSGHELMEAGSQS